MTTIYHHVPLVQRPDGAWARAQSDDEPYATLTDLVRDYSSPGVDVYRLKAGSPHRPQVIDPPDFLFVAYDLDDEMATPVYFGADWERLDDEDPTAWGRYLDIKAEGRPCAF